MFSLNYEVTNYCIGHRTGRLKMKTKDEKGNMLVE